MTITQTSRGRVAAPRALAGSAADNPSSAWSSRRENIRRPIAARMAGIMDRPRAAAPGSAMLGTAVAIGELRGLLAAGLAFAGCFSKSRMEEKWLLQEFGTDQDPISATA